MAFTDTTSTSLTNTWKLYRDSVSPSNFMAEDSASLTTVRTSAFTITKKVLSGTVKPWGIVTYEIDFKNTGNSPITSYLLSDPLQNSTYVVGSSRLNGTVLLTPTVTPNNIITRWCRGTDTTLNNQPVCPLQVWVNGILTFDVKVQ
jgi:uncharacterized repeat protein (TIGR01451 family)